MVTLKNSPIDLIYVVDTQRPNALEHVSATLKIDAPVAQIFSALADPKTQASIDGSGWVQGVIDQTLLTGVDQVFRMQMHHDEHPDGDYQTANKVITFDKPRAIGRPSLSPFGSICISHHLGRTISAIR